MATFLSGIEEAPLILALLYLGTSIYGFRRMFFFIRLYLNFDCNKAFVSSVFIACTLRFLCFTVVGLWSLNPESSLSAQSKELKDTIIILLMTLPEFFVLSSYSLLILVWTDIFIQSRSHWLSEGKYRGYWNRFIKVINVCIFLAQALIYTILFLSSADQALTLKILCSVLGALNILLGSFQIFVFFCLSYAFSGFPYHSQNAHYNISVIAKQICFWTLSRLLWGSILIVSLKQDWLSPSFSSSLGKSQVISCFTIVALFCGIELGPLFRNMKHEVLMVLITQNNYSDSDSDTHLFALGLNYGASFKGRFNGMIFSPALQKASSIPLERNHKTYTWEHKHRKNKRFSSDFGDLVII
mmetsp:Transcript_336/g.430  ORF Transcript_336/g.430 Transcript_336/m.430 type:complete len:356 (+) Transcript_336:111-1178(+)